MADYYFRSGRNEFGPLTTSQLQKLAAAGRLTADDEVRRGSGEWLRASMVPGLFDHGRRPSEAAINEMDVLAGLAQSPVPQAPLRAERETAFEAQVTKPAAIRSRAAADVASQGARRRPPNERSVAWPRAVSALCYMSSVLAVALGAFGLVSAQNIACEILGGVCFLIAILSLGCGCAINLLADLQSSGGRHPP